MPHSQARHSDADSPDAAAHDVTQDLLAEVGHASQESEFFNATPPGYVPGRHKYVAVFGTVMSGLGKGILSSSLAKLLKDKGLSVEPIKIVVAQAFGAADQKIALRFQA